MILKTHNTNQIAIAEILVNEANLSQADALKAEMIVLIDTHPKKILVDFNQVQYVDSTFLGAMVSSLKYAVANKTDIAVMRLPQDIHNLFTLIRLDKVFKIYADEAEALSDIN
ncbi:MAG: STAS domain-containing protein [Bacteroidota bacterium]